MKKDVHVLLKNDIDSHKQRRNSPLFTPLLPTCAAPGEAKLQAAAKNQLWLDACG